MPGLPSHFSVNGTAGGAILHLLHPSAGTALGVLSLRDPCVTEPFLIVVTCSSVHLELPSFLPSHFVTSPSHASLELSP